mmetsp:Transcript_23529/g.53243  ORF Transcript_23529/g.53243 Transcript_23529/m.53243 type:complete len:221 (-) Transcript_23529:188-850(-)
MRAICHIVGTDDHIANSVGFGLQGYLRAQKADGIFTFRKLQADVSVPVDIRQTNHFTFVTNVDKIAPERMVNLSHHRIPDAESTWQLELHIAWQLVPLGRIRVSAEKVLSALIKLVGGMADHHPAIPNVYAIAYRIGLADHGIPDPEASRQLQLHMLLQNIHLGKNRKSAEKVVAGHAGTAEHEPAVTDRQESLLACLVNLADQTIADPETAWQLQLHIV